MLSVTQEQALKSGATKAVVLERKPEVLRRTGLSNTALYSAMSRGLFPRPVSLGTGRAVAWLQSEVDAFIAARIAERDARLTEDTEA